MDKSLEKIKTHILCSVTCFTENRAIYEIMWKNIVEPNRHHMTIGCMKIACQIPKGTDTLPEYLIFIAIPVEQWLHEYASMSHYIYIYIYIYIYVARLVRI